MSNKGFKVGSKRIYSLEDLAEIIAYGQLLPEKVVAHNGVVYFWNGTSYVSELGNELFQTVMANYVTLMNEANRSKLVDFIYQ